ncbi:MAG TPA: hypothetical protein VF755_06725 [Catenuloplanes sp.]
MTLFAILFFMALSGSSFFALGRTFGRGERYEKGYRAGFRDGEMGSLARATRLRMIEPDATAILTTSALPFPEQGTAAGRAVVTGAGAGGYDKGRHYRG